MKTLKTAILISAFVLLGAGTSNAGEISDEELQKVAFVEALMPRTLDSTYAAQCAVIGLDKTGKTREEVSIMTLAALEKNMPCCMKAVREIKGKYGSWTEYYRALGDAIDDDWKSVTKACRE